MKLSPREFEVISLKRAGWTNAKIARWLGIAEGTVKSVASRAYAKLGISEERRRGARGRRNVYRKVRS